MDVSLLRQDLRNMVDSISGAKGRMSELEDTVHDLQTTVTCFSTSNHTLTDRVEDVKNRAWRCNVRFVGFLEGAEGSALETFLEQWITS